MSAARTLSAQIQEVQREIQQRERIYAREVRSGRMRQGVADEHMLRMRCVLRTLEWLRENETKIRAALKKGAG